MILDFKIKKHLVFIQDVLIIILLIGGGRWIRTIVGAANGFTVRPL